MSKNVSRAQTENEARNAEMRKNVLKYDDVMNDQRTVVYTERRSILEGENMESMVQGFLDFVVDDVVSAHTADDNEEAWDLSALWTDLK
ncbi:hypothetical protein QP095_10050, partial [Aerococcus urinae]|nr:hypothetical protein [Aerococcus urinae]